MVAGNMVVSMGVRAGGILCDMQKVANTVPIAPVLSSDVSLCVTNRHPCKVMVVQGEVVQNPAMPAGVQAVAWAHIQPDTDPNAIFVGTCSGMLQFFRTAACC